jgi:hypothetical protein
MARTYEKVQGRFREGAPAEWRVPMRRVPGRHQTTSPRHEAHGDLGVRGHVDASVGATAKEGVVTKARVRLDLVDGGSDAERRL